MIISKLKILFAKQEKSALSSSVGRSGKDFPPARATFFNAEDFSCQPFAVYVDELNKALRKKREKL